MSVDQARIDLLNLTGHDTLLKKKGGTNGGEWVGPCPFCSGKDRFIVWPQHPKGARWWCRREEVGGDAIAYVRKRDNVSFEEAVKTLGLELQRQSLPRRNRQPDRPTPPQRASTAREWAALHDPVWQQAAFAFVNQATERLYEPAGERALAYLRGRGFSDITLGLYWIGFNPVDLRTRWGEVDVFVSAGVVIPWLYRGDVWRINIRRRTGSDPKYLSVTGSANGLYNVQQIRRDKPELIVEGEFDALAIQQAAGDLVTPVATGATTGGRLLKWLSRLAQAPRHYVCFDADEAGDTAAKFWLDVLPGARRLQPSAHDPNDMLIQGGNEALRQWVLDVL